MNPKLNVDFDLDPRLDSAFTADESERFEEDRITAAVSTSASPPAIKGLWASLGRWLGDRVRYAVLTLYRSIFHAVFYGFVFFAAFAFSKMAIYLSGRFPLLESGQLLLDDIRLEMLPWIFGSLIVVLTTINLFFDGQWWLHTRYPIPNWLLAQRTAWLKPRILLGNKTIFVGGTQVAYSFNEHCFLAMSPGSTFLMKVDRSLFDEAREVGGAFEDWRGVQKTPLVLIKLKNGAEIPIHGAYFEKEINSTRQVPTEFVTSWVKDINKALGTKKGNQETAENDGT